MENPYLDRVAARMRRDDALSLLNSHWSARSERAVHWVGYQLEQAGLVRLSNGYTWLTEPLTSWLGYRQAVFLRRWL